jgi:hypothetical protein
MTESTTTDAGEGTTTEGEQQQAQATTFTQADIDRIVKDRLAQQAKTIAAKFSDYDETKAKAETAKTLEDRLGSLEAELTSTKASALRTSIAAKFGVSTEKGAKGEPSDADLFLTGTDEETLTAQAQRLSTRQADLKKQGNVAPNEGGTNNQGTGGTDLRDFAKSLFGTSE